jgi:hypothetical protein
MANLPAEGEGKGAASAKVGLEAVTERNLSSGRLCLQDVNCLRLSFCQEHRHLGGEVASDGVYGSRSAPARG